MFLFPNSNELLLLELITNAYYIILNYIFKKNTYY